MAAANAGSRTMFASGFPPGSALAYANPDRKSSVIIDPTTGSLREVDGEATTWTKGGELAVIRRL